MPARSPHFNSLYAKFREELAEEVRRRSLEAWMRTHRAEVEALLAEGDMDWEAAARHFVTAGLLDAKGGLPDAAVAEATWRRVQAAAKPKGRR